jgi:hypothetical protein
MASLTEDLQRAAAAGNRVRLVELLAAAQFPGTEAAAASSLRSGAMVTAALRAFPWDRLAPLRTAAGRQQDVRGQAATRILDDLQTALEVDEITQSLPQVLRETDEAIFRWLADGQPPPPPPPSGPERGLHPKAASGSRTRAKGMADQSVLADLGQFLRDHPDEQVTVEWRVVE